jgi:hypothetical protein
MQDSTCPFEDQRQDLWLLADMMVLACCLLSCSSLSFSFLFRRLRSLTFETSLLRWVPTNHQLAQIEPERQTGPTCGLVALHMAANELWKRAPPASSHATADPFCSVQELLAAAVGRGFSAQGEMFSAPDLAELARDSYHLQTHILQEPTALDVCAVIALGRCVHPPVIPAEEPSVFLHWIR